MPDFALFCIKLDTDLDCFFVDGIDVFTQQLDIVGRLYYLSAHGLGQLAERLIGERCYCEIAITCVLDDKVTGTIPHAFYWYSLPRSRISDIDCPLLEGVLLAPHVFAISEANSQLASRLGIDANADVQLVLYIGIPCFCWRQLCAALLSCNILLVSSWLPNQRILLTDAAILHTENLPAIHLLQRDLAVAAGCRNSVDHDRQSGSVEPEDGFVSSIYIPPCDDFIFRIGNLFQELPILKIIFLVCQLIAGFGEP